MWNRRFMGLQLHNNSVGCILTGTKGERPWTWVDMAPDYFKKKG